LERRRLISVRLQNNELKVAGKVQQPRIQPVQIDAQLPLNLSKLIAEKKLDEQTPVNASIQMPRSSINFVRQFVPALNQLDGTVALDVKIGGTIAKPDLSGSADTNINLRDSKRDPARPDDFRRCSISGKTG
jgi:hypothetical protein